MRTHYGGLIYALGLHLLMIFIHLLLRFYWDRRDRQCRSAYGSKDNLTESGDPTNIKEPQASTANTTMTKDQNSALMQSYQRAFAFGGVSTGSLSASLSMNFSFENLGLTLRGGKSVLNGMTGEIRAGRLTAIVDKSQSWFD